MNRVSFVLSICLLLSYLNAFTQSTEPTLKTQFLIEAGIEYGGDELLEVLFTTGDSQTMLAGQGGNIAIGAQFQLTQIEKLSLRTSIGLKYNTTAADNANIRLTRFPINVVAYWKIAEDFRIGVGGTSHQGVRLNGDDFFNDVDFTSSIGPRFEFGYKWAALSYTTVNYTDDMDTEFSASSIGLSLSFTLPKN